MHEVELILTLTGALAVALVLGFITDRFKLSPIVGYLLAGIAVGPYTPGYTANQALASQLAEVGVILLMFGVGLKFHLRELLSVQRIAIPGAIVQSAIATGLGIWITRAFGWSLAAGVVFGLAVSVASTVVLIRVLADNNELQTATGRVAVGWLVVEDLFTVLALVILPALFGANAASGGALMATLVAVLKIGAFVAILFVVGDRLVPRLLGYVVSTRSRELFTLSVLVVALGLSVAAAQLFGASMALGAFMAGMIVARSDFALRAASDALPMRDAFAVLFFVSVGMLFRPAFILDRPGLVAATAAIILIGKPLAAIAIVRLLRYPRRVALGVGVALAQIGEFSFILSTLGTELEILPPEAGSTLVATAILSITLNPLLYRLLPRLERWLPPEKSKLSKGSDHSRHDARHRAVVVGWGPIGQTVYRLLESSGIHPTIIELNLETVRRLRSLGVPAIYGDASRQEVLEEAGIQEAASLILSANSEDSPAEIVKLAHELNPKLFVIARCAYLKDVEKLRGAGAAAAFSGEGEVALAMTAFVLERLGATPEQIDIERDRLYRRLIQNGTTTPVPQSSNS